MSDSFILLCLKGIGILIFPLYLLTQWIDKHKPRGTPLDTAPKSDQNISKWDPLRLSRLKAFSKARDEDRLPDFFAELYQQTQGASGQQVRTLNLCIVGTNALITSDPKNIQFMLALQFEDFGLGSVRAGGYQPLLLGRGIFSTDGKPWEHSRRMLRPQFAREQLSDLALEEELTRDFLNAIPQADTEGWTPEFDITPWFFKLTMDSSTEFFLGDGTYSLRRPGVHDDFVEAFDRCEVAVSRRLFLGNLYWLHNPSGFKDDIKKVFAWTDARVKSALDKFGAESSSDDRLNGKYSFIRELIRETRDPIELRSQLLSIAMAGRETTAALLSWTYYLLARHPAQYSAIRQEVLREFGSKNDEKEISFGNLRGCKSLQNLMNESLRLFPPVPFNQRQAMKNTTLPRGGGGDGSQPLSIAKNTSILIDVYHMHRDPEYWGADADEFRPDRWNGLKAGWEYLPFNGGPRICMGQMLALTNAGYYIVKLMQNFDQITTTDTRPAKVHAAIVAVSSHGTKVKLHHA